MAVSHIEVVQLAVSDLARASHFYADAFGLRRLAAGPGDGGVGDFVLLNATHGTSLQLQIPTPGEPNSVVAFEFEKGSPIEETLRSIEALGGRVTYRRAQSGDWLVVGFMDPDGNACELLIPT